MHFNFCRTVDGYLGPIICRALLLLKGALSFISSPPKNELQGTPKKIIIIKFLGMGTILLASPSIRRIKEKYPSATITLLTLFDNRELCSIMRSFDQRFYVDIGGSPLRFFFSYLKILYAIRRERYDTVIDLEFVTNFSAVTTLLITIFSKATRIVGFNSPQNWRNSVYFHIVSFDHSRHISMIFAKMLAIITLDSTPISTEKEKEELLQAADISFYETEPKLKNISENSQRLICVNINSGPMSHLRRWPKESFAHVIKQLIKKYDVLIVLIGGKGDVSYTNGFSQQFFETGNIINLCGKLSISQLIGLFFRSYFLITNDSGPLHIAATVGLPTISFFGPETPYLYGPQGKKHHVFYSDIFCSPCLNIFNSKFADCHENVCLKQISPESVLKVIDEKFLPGLSILGEL